MDSFREIGEVDYDPFAGASEPAAAPAYKEIREVDFDPFEEGSIVKEVPKGVAAGAVETTGSGIKGAAGIKQSVIHSFAQEAARKKALEAQLPEPTGIEKVFPGLRQATPEQTQKAIEAGEQVPAPDITQDPWFKTGQAMQDWSQEQFRAATDFENSWTTAISKGLGSTLPYLAAGVVGGPAGVAAGTAAGLATSSGEAIDRAVAAGASKEDILKSLQLGALPGLTEQLPIEVMLERIPLPMVGRFIGVLGKIAAKASVEGGQEAVQQSLQNVVEKFVYDPEQHLGEGVLESAVIGAAVGGGIGAVTSRPTKAEKDTVENAGDATPGGLGADPAPPVGAGAAVTEQAPVAGQPPTPAKNEAKPVTPDTPVAPAATSSPGGAVTVMPPGTVAPDQAAALGPPIPVDEDEDSDILPDAWEPEEAPGGPPIVEPAPTPPAAPATTATPAPAVTPTAKIGGVDADIAAVLGDIDAIMGRMASTEQAPPAIVPPPSPVRADTVAPTAETPVPTVEPQGSPMPSPVAPAPAAPVAAPDVSLAPGEPVEALQPPLAVSAQPEPLPLPAAAPVAAFREIREVDYDPFAGTAGEATPAGPVLATEPALAPALAQPSPEVRQVEEMLWQDVRSSPEFDSLDVQGQARLPEVVRAVATRISEAAPRKKGESRSRHLERQRDLGRAGVEQVYEKYRTASQEQETTRAAEAAATSKRTMEEARQTGAPAERARAGKRKGKTAEEVKGQSRYSWMRLVKKELEKPEGERSPEVVQYHEAKEARKKVAQHKRRERGELTAKMQAAEEAYIKHLQVKEEAAPKPPPPPSSAVTAPGETAPAVREPSPQQVKNDKVAAQLASTLKQFPQPTDRQIMVDKGKSIIQSFNDQVAATGVKLGKVPMFGTGVDANGKPRPTLSPEENLAIFARSLTGRRQSNPFENITDFVAALTLYKGGTPSDIESMKGLMTTEKIDAREVHANTMTSVSDEIGYFPEQDMRKGGRMEAVKLPDGSDRRPLSGATEDAIPIHVKDPDTGRTLRMDSTASMTGAEALKGVRKHWSNVFRGQQVVRDFARQVEGRQASDVNFYGGGLGLSNVLFRLTNKQITALVGDIQVDFVSDADLKQLSGQQSWGGAYMNYSAEERASGAKPRILINKEYYDQSSPLEQHHVIMHEMTHAATSYALEHNIRGVKQIVTTMRTMLQKQVIAAYGDVPSRYQYGFTNNAEFIAQAFSDPDFQELLATAPMPEHTAAAVNNIAHTHGHKITSWWDAFVRMVARALAPWHRKGQISYLEQLIKVAPQISMTSAEQQFDAESGRASGPGMEGASHPLQVGPFNVELKAAMRDADLRANSVGDFFSRGALKLQTTENLKRRAGYWYEDGVEKFNKLADLLLSSATHRRAYQKEAAEVIGDLAQLYHKDRVNFDKAADIAFDATKKGYHPAYLLSHAENAHLKGGVRDAQAVAGHADAHARWMQLPQEMRDGYLKASELLKNQENQRIEKTVRDILETAMRAPPAGLGVTLPPGVSEQDAIDWVVNGGIDRQPGDPANPKATDQTPADAALHKALGKTAKSLTGTKEMRRIKGMYVPLSRWGRYFFTARKKIAIPTGATLDRQDKSGTHLVFRNANRKANDNAVKDFLAKSEDIVTHKVSEWIDPLTGKRTTANNVYVDPNNPTGPLIQPVQQWRVVVQDRYMEMADGKRELKKLQEDYKAQGFTEISDLALLDTVLHANNEVLPQHVNRMLHSVEQSHAGNQSGVQQNVQGAIVAAYIRQLGGNRAQHRRLKRRTVGGHSKDFLRSIHSASMTMAGHLAQLDLAPKMADAERELQKFINDGRQAGKGKTARRQEMYGELKTRMTAGQRRTENTTGDRWSNALMQTSFVKHLASPAYSIFNGVGGQTTTWAMLAAEFGPGAALREQSRALYDLGVRKIFGTGFAETGRAARDLALQHKPAHRGVNYDEMVKATVKDPGFGAVVDRMVDLGYGATSGLEIPEVSEIGKNAVERVIGRGSAIARAVPEAVETVNRYVTALTAYRLAKRAGWSEQRAAEYAVTTVEKTQGGYAAENNPAFMSGKYSKIPLQFKKYPLMYGQLYWGAVEQMLGPNNDRETRVRGAKEFVYLSGVTVVLAGSAGLPMMEVAKMFFLAGSMLGLTDGDWEDEENNMQRYYASALQWLTGSKSNAEFYSEAMAYGLPRMIGLETSSRLGNSSSLTHGAPRVGSEGLEWGPWIFDMLLGAPGGMVADIGGAIQDGDLAKTLPLPKLAKDIFDAHEKASEGYVNKFGRQTADPLTLAEAATKAVGIKPASEARQWEAFGTGAKDRVKGKVKADRTRTMGEWANAAPSDRPKILRTVIRDWNKAHPKDRIDMADLKRSIASRKSHAKRERKEELMENLGR